MATITTKETKPFDWMTFDRAKLNVGDEISDVLKNGEKVVFVVMDNGVIGLKNCLARKHYMNKIPTNNGGWIKCGMRRYLNEEIFDLLPDDLQKIIKSRAFGKEQDKLWLFSEVEIFGEQNSIEKENNCGTQFEYFKNPSNRVKCDIHGNSMWWWERSPRTAFSTSFCFVYNSGTINSGYANGSYGVCFGFYI